MTKVHNYKKRVFGLLIALGALVVLLALMLILRTSTSVSEWMASNVSRGWISFFSVITGIFPFSLYEFLLYVAIIGGIALLITAIVLFCKHKALRAVSFLLIFAIIGVGFGNIYTLAAGFTYYRGEPDLPMSATTEIHETEADEFFALAEFMVDDFNAVAARMQWDEEGRMVSPYSFSELAKKLRSEYERLDSDYYSDFTPMAKPITSKRIMSNMHLSGVFFAPFGEANVNPLTPSCDLPVTMAHELAHAKGAMRESDANLTAYYITVTSDDPFLRYSGYMNTYALLLDVVYKLDGQKYAELRGKLDERIFVDARLGYEFWQNYTLFDDITEKFNDLYLKLSGQGGTGSYTEPTKPPSVVTKPDESGEGEIKEVVCPLNTVQKTILKAIEDRAEAEKAENTGL